MKCSGAEVVTRVLKREGVRFLFGIPGTHNIELYDRLAEEADLHPVLITDEQSSAFLADGVARASGQLAVANLVPGAGLTHAMSGIAECFLDQIPLLVLACGIRRDTGAAFQLHDIDQAAVVRPVCKQVFQPATHQELYAALGEACTLARRAPAGPVVVEVPANLYLIPGEVQEAAAVPPSVPAPPNVSEIADALNRADSIVMYVGLGAMPAGPALVQLADRLDALVFTSISGKGAYPEDNPRWAWNMMGRAAPAAFRKAARDSDCVLAIGCRFAEVATGSYGFEMPETLIHVDADASVFDRNYKANHKLQADSRAFVEALLVHGLLNYRPQNKARLDALQEAHRDIARQQRETSGERVQPAALLDCISRIGGPDTVFAADSGNGTFLAMELLRLTRPRSFLAPVDYSCMGYSVPAAIGAKLSCPDRPVIALAGDGAFLMTGLELATAAAQNAGVIVFLLRDRELSQIAQFQKASMNRQTCTELPDYEAEHIARATGCEFLRLEKTEDVESIVRLAFETVADSKPVLVDVAIDYTTPTYFSKGVVITNFLRFSWKDRIRMVSRLLQRKITNLAPRS